MSYVPVIGLEVHLELQTKSKMFCGCSTQIFQAEPNTHTCPVCLGLPGALPVVNKAACESCLQIGLALGCSLLPQAVFARKHYSYPDLAKGYQISQYELPFCTAGTLTLASGKVVRITRAHMEEDTGKLVHSQQQGKEVSFVDFNRCGIPLVEIVSEPDIADAQEAEEYGRSLQQLMQYLGVSEASMEKGLMRFEANISLRKQTDPMDYLPNYKVEVKNLNSFKALREAIEYEIKRHAQLLDNGQTPAQETRGWDDAKGQTYAQREKENAHDYRYFPDPDITPMTWMQQRQPELLKQLPELPWQKKNRYQTELGLSAYDAHVLTLEKQTAFWFEKAIACIPSNRDTKAVAKKLSNWVTVECARIANQTQQPLHRSKLEPHELVAVVISLEDNKLSNTNAKLVVEELYLQGGKAAEVIKAKGLEQVDDPSLVEASVNKVLSEQPKAVTDYKGGKTTVIMFLIGMVMKELKGKGNTENIKQIIEKQLH